MAKIVHGDTRDYDPRLGRWTGKDPLGLAGGGNVYAYMGNKPSDGTDPLGLLPSPADFTKSTGCCEAAKYFGLKGSVVCSILYHEYSFYNPASWVEDAWVSASGGLSQLGGTFGPFGLSPVDVRQLLNKAPRLGPDRAAYIGALYNNSPYEGQAPDFKIRRWIQNERDATFLFSGLQALRVKANHWENLSQLDQANELMKVHNPGTGWRSKVISYKDKWEKNRQSYLDAFQKVCDENCDK